MYIYFLPQSTTSHKMKPKDSANTAGVVRQESSIATEGSTFVMPVILM